MSKLASVCSALFCLAIAGPALAQQPAPAAPAAPTAAPAALAIGGDVKMPMTFTPEALKALPRKTVEVKDQDGRVVRHEGVLVAELLRLAGAALGRDFRGDAVATYVLASASDGYQVVFSLAELDPDFSGSEIIVADTTDGKPLFGYQGPFRIVAPRDTRAARSIRMLQRIEVVRVKK